jgi:hypothetical protein
MPIHASQYTRCFAEFVIILLPIYLLYYFLAGLAAGRPGLAALLYTLTPAPTRSLDTPLHWVTCTTEGGGAQNSAAPVSFLLVLRTVCHWILLLCMGIKKVHVSVHRFAVELYQRQHSNIVLGQLLTHPEY